MKTDAPRAGRIVWLFTFFEGGLALFAWGLSALLDQPIEKQLRWNAVDLSLGLAACLPMLLAFWLCLRATWAPFVRVRRLVRNFIRPLFTGATLYELAILCLCAGIGEELLFRGVLQESLGRWLGVGAGLALASLVFGLLHALTPAYFVLATLLGAFLGGLLLLRGNLLAPIIAHGMYDWVALAYVVRGTREDSAKPRP